MLPEIVRAVSEPLAKTGSITTVSTDGEGTGASKLTADVTRIMAELPAVVEWLSGIELSKLVAAVPALKAAMKDESSEPKNRLGVLRKRRLTPQEGGSTIR